MGQFSWNTQDTNVPIYNDWEEHGDKQTVHMVDPRDGTDYKEEAYEGYGRFGGRDFYELFADINKELIKSVCSRVKYDETIKEILNKDFHELTENDIDSKRLLGIDFWFSFIEPDGTKSCSDLPEGAKWYSPILVEDYNKWTSYKDAFKFPESDSNQGWHVIEDE